MRATMILNICNHYSANCARAHNLSANGGVFHRRGERGAVMVVGLFMGIVLAALLYHIVGVGQSAVENQLSQSAADSITYSAATVKARGMNTIALINLVMATVLAVLVAVRLIEMLLVTAIAMVGVACVFSGGAACGAIAPLVKVEHELHSFAENMEDTVHSILQSLEEVADAVNQAVPVLAEAEAVYISKKEGLPVSAIGFVWPVVDELPTQKGTFEELCEQAGKQVVNVSTFFLPGDLPEKANDTIGELLGSMASRFTRFFCGGGNPPAKTRSNEVAYPVSTDLECDAADASPPDTGDGCGTELCRLCAQKACNSCSSRLSDKNFVKARWVFEEWKWVEQPTSDGGAIVARQWPVQKNIKWLSEPPCETSPACGKAVLCETETRQPDSTYGVGAVQVTQTKYRQILSCIVEEDMTMKTPQKVDGEKWPRPRVLKKDAVRDDFRVWGIDLGKNGASERLGKVGKMFHMTDENIPDARIGTAGAEFLSPSNDMWHLHWYSRLIRFRLPADSVLGNDCGGNNAAACRRVGQHLNRIRSIAGDQMVH